MINSFKTAAGGGYKAAFFWLAVLAGIILPWLAPHLPLVDLPQHAAQIAALRDHWRDDFIWSNIAAPNYLTPYLLFYLPAAALSLLLPLQISLALMISLGFAISIFTGLWLCKAYDAPNALDPLLLFGFFGAAWHWGMVTFLLSTPLFYLFLIVAKNFAEIPRYQNGFLLTLAGIFLFCAHILAFILGAFIAGFLCLGFLKMQPLKRALAYAPPFIAFALLIIAYALTTASANQINGADIIEMTSFMQRLVNFFLLPFMGSFDIKALVIFVLLWAIPFDLGYRIDRQNWIKCAPILAFILFWLITPANVYGTYFVYQRYALFALPLYLLAFKAHPKQVAKTAKLARSLLILLPLIFMGQMGYRLISFTAEEQDFREIVAELSPKQRVLMLIFETKSDAFKHYATYTEWGAWYQADKQGWIDFNFASYFPQVIRYKTDLAPASYDRLVFYPHTFDWHADRGKDYRYFIIRSSEDSPMPEGLQQLFNQNADHCTIKQIAAKGFWQVYENQGCG